MFGIGFLTPLKKIISLQDNTIKNLREGLVAMDIISHNKQLEIDKLKKEIISLESELNSKLTDVEKLFRQYKKNGFITKGEVINLTADINDIGISINKDGKSHAVYQEGKGWIETPKINTKLQAWYNRGKGNSNYKSKKKDIFSFKPLKLKDQPVIKGSRKVKTQENWIESQTIIRPSVTKKEHEKWNPKKLTKRKSKNK